MRPSVGAGAGGCWWAGGLGSGLGGGKRRNRVGSYPSTAIASVECVKEACPIHRFHRAPIAHRRGRVELARGDSG